MRIFLISLYHGHGNMLKTTATIEAETMFKAFDKFCFAMNCTGYPMRQEPTQTLDGITYMVFSAGCNISGQRIYIKERI